MDSTILGIIELAIFGTPIVLASLTMVVLIGMHLSTETGDRSSYDPMALLQARADREHDITSEPLRAAA
jgi:hypothetical protein